MVADLTKYRTCVTHLQGELTQLSADQQRWEDNFKLSRNELSTLHLNSFTKLQNLQTESEILTSLLARELLENQDQSEGGLSEAQLVEMAIAQLAGYDSQIANLLNSEIAEKESIPEPVPVARNNKRKSAPSTAAAGDQGTKVFAFTPPSTSSSLSHLSSSNEENIVSLHSKLVDFLEASKKIGAVPSDDATVESRYSRVLAHLAESFSASAFAPALKSSIHSGCLENEREALLLAASPFPETEIRQHLRHYLNPSPHHSNDPTAAVAGDHSVDNNGGNSIAQSRGTRRRKPMTTRQTQQSTQLQLTALRRTPQNQPLFLSPTSPFEDSYGGVILRIQGEGQTQGEGHGEGERGNGMATVDNLFSFSSSYVVPESLGQLESLVSRVSQSRACLQRGIRTLSALEREKIEWLSQLEKLKPTFPMKDLLETEFGIMKPTAHSNPSHGAVVASMEKSEIAAAAGGGGAKSKASGASSGKTNKSRASSGGNGEVEVSLPAAAAAQGCGVETAATTAAAEIAQEVTPVVVPAAAPVKETRKSSGASSSAKKAAAKKKSR
jgi:hypothetical protein